jgi:hypothetical protein
VDADPSYLVDPEAKDLLVAPAVEVAVGWRCIRRGLIE